MRFLSTSFACAMLVMHLGAQTPMMEVPVRTDTLCQARLVAAQRLLKEGRGAEAQALCNECLVHTEDEWAYYVRAHSHLLRMDTTGYCVDVAYTGKLAPSLAAETAPLCVARDSGSVAHFTLSEQYFPGVVNVCYKRWRWNGTQIYTLYDARDTVLAGFTVAEGDTFYSSLEQKSEFKGGLGEMRTWIGKHIDYPKAALVAGIQGKVWVEFLVNEQGKVTKVKVRRSPNEELSAEALRVVNMMPSWKPGKAFGRAVCTKYYLPIDFALE